MADCTTGYSHEASADPYIDWHSLDAFPRRTRSDSFVNLMRDAENPLPDLEADIDHSDIALLQFSSYGSECDSHSCATSLEDTLQLPQLRPKKTKKRPLQQAKEPPARVATGKQIGTITLEERKKKIERFLEKRKRRNWVKKISYDCRKRVADNRLRVKGRFVTKGQAISSLGLEYVQKLLTDPSPPARDA